ncbi:MAG: hypothetical protein QM724_12170 [Flavobacteriales bacterium]
MKLLLLFVLPLLLCSGCNAQQFIQAAEQGGVTIGYKWTHKEGKPSLLQLRIANPTGERCRVHADIDLYHQGFTVEQFSADTIIGPHRTLTGRLNGIYFTPRSLTPEQLRSSDTRVEVTGFTVEPVPAE